MSLPAHPRRFYKTATVIDTNGGHGISLDGRIPKTPAKNPLVLPNLASAALVANEWDAQGESVIPASMPLTRLVNVAIDRGHDTRDAMIDEIVKYAKTDLVCYRAASPQSLVEAQAAAWDPLMAWAQATYGIDLLTTYDALAIAQPEASITSLRTYLVTLDVWHLTALGFANGLAGSAIVALALVDRIIDGEAAFKAIRVEEDWQAARWGTDPDEAIVANARRLDLVAVYDLVVALRGA